MTDYDYSNGNKMGKSFAYDDRQSAVFGCPFIWPNAAAHLRIPQWFRKPRLFGRSTAARAAWSPRVQVTVNRQ